MQRPHWRVLPSECDGADSWPAIDGLASESNGAAHQQCRAPTGWVKSVGLRSLATADLPQHSRAVPRFNWLRPVVDLAATYNSRMY